MNGNYRTAPTTSQPMSRDLMLTLIDAAFKTNELRYARRLCTSWLAVYPGDLQVNLLFARAYNNEASSELKIHALPILQELCKLDPEFKEAQELLATVQQTAGSVDSSVAKACASALSHGNDVITGKSGHVSSWSKNVYVARTALNEVRAGDYQQIEKAEYYIHKALIENPDTPLAAVTHLRLLDSKGSMPKMAVRSLAEIYHQRWPDCLQFTLTLSNELMASGESNQAVTMLHEAVSRDIAGQVPKRMWGISHQYASLWPTTLEASNSGPNSPQNIQIPAAVASYMGWNQLSAMSTSFDVNLQDGSQAFAAAPGQTKTSFQQHPYIPHSFSNETDSSTLSESVKSVQTELERMADELKRPHVVREDGRFPVYVIFTTRAGVEAQYGASAFPAIDAELKKLVKLINGRKVNQEFWGSLLLYADDISKTPQFGLKSARYNDAWQLKLVLNDLDAALEKRGERIGALLIVGGPEIVPFHNLPNPVEDADNEVQSDNPYAARDSNYFICDWPVGRVSGGADNDPRHLLKIIKEINNRYDPAASQFAWYRRFIGYIQELFRRGVSKKQSSFGYTAAVWKRASLSVFRSIGESSDLLVSPPIHACDAPEQVAIDTPYAGNNGKSDACLLLPTARLGYFNLHGVPDGSEWYGQTDPAQPEDGPDFPVAMRPEDIRNSGSAPHLVFTEACYGANILGKMVDDAISLKFLASGTQAVIGSTGISYGTLSTPLSSADLLGRVFWSLLQEGFTAGESLRRAKIHLTREMHRRQGYLDAEDQKTIISFVLFGDPLAQPFKTKVSPKITPHLSDSAVPVPTVCEHSCDNDSEAPVPLETMTHLKSIVEQYLPGMSDAKMSFRQERQACSNLCNHCATGGRCAISESSGKNNPIKLQRRVVTLSKSYQKAQYVHRQFARLTLDDSGKVIKMVVSH